jgi:hypothetical protein
MSKSWILLLIFVVLLLLLTSAGRSAIGLFLSKTFIQAVGYGIFAIKFLFQSHLTIIRNLLLPRRVIYPTLEKDDSVKRG